MEKGHLKKEFLATLAYSFYEQQQLVLQQIDFWKNKLNQINAEMESINLELQRRRKEDERRIQKESDDLNKEIQDFKNSLK